MNCADGVLVCLIRTVMLMEMFTLRPLLQVTIVTNRKLSNEHHCNFSFLIQTCFDYQTVKTMFEMKKVCKTHAKKVNLLKSFDLRANNQ